MDVSSVPTVAVAVAGAVTGLLAGIYQGRVALARAAHDRETAIDNRTNQLLDRLQKEVDDLRAGRDDVLRRSQECEVARAVLEERVAGQQRQIDRIVASSATSGTPVVELLADKSGIITDVSDGLPTLLGYRAAQVIGRPVHMLLPPEMRDLHRRAYDASTLSHDPTSRQWRPISGDALHADGSRVSVVVVVQRTADGYRGYICPLTSQLPV